MWSLILIASLVHCISGQVRADPPQVTISQGIVQGTETDGIFEFYAIPYADSTSGTHRFKAPLPAPSFTDTFVANRRNVKCVRPLGVGYEGTEDCLVVDIFTPSLSDTSQLPVMVWIKGKEFDPATEPEMTFRNLVDKEVVVVSLNFRESILGFLCLGTETAPGNAGLKDIIAGLQWVQENIAQFGGNPESVTLIGHGTGAAAVDLVTLSPMVPNLVQRAIMQSGNSIAPWSVTRDPTKYAIIVAEALGHTITDIESLSEVFTRTSVGALMAVINELDLTDNSLAFAPCIENENLTGVLRFMDKSPYSTLVDGDYLQIPVMIGFVENEGTIRVEEAIEADWLEKMDSSFTDFLQPDLEFESDVDELSIAEQVKTFYFGDRPINIENVADYVSYHGDTMIKVSALREAKLRASNSEAPVYLYEFSYKGELGEAFIGPMIASIVGPAHREELAYLLDTRATTTTDDNYVRNILLERWTNFAKTGVPNSAVSSTEWLPLTSESVNVLLIRNDENAKNDPNLELAIVNPHQEAITFWEEIYSEHFLDAEGKWTFNGRDEEDDDVITTEAPVTNPPDTDVNTEPPTTSDPGEETTPAPGSASTAVGYTFLVITLFAVLDKFHSTLMLA